MAYAIKITGSNFTFQAPEGRDDVVDLHVFRNRIGTVSRWKLEQAELEEITRTGSIYLFIMGDGMPPVFVASETIMRGHVADYGPLPSQAHEADSPEPDPSRSGGQSS